MITARFSRVAAFLLLLLLVFGVGCHTVQRVPSGKQSRVVQEGTETVVLLRLDAVLEQESVAVLNRYSRRPGRGFTLRLANLDAPSAPKPIHPVISPSAAARAEGWVYLTLAPGSYWLVFLPPGAVTERDARAQDVSVPLRSGDYGIIDKGEYRPLAGFRLSVLGNEGVLYAGTLTFDEAEPDRGLQRSRPGPGRITDETEDARLVADKSFAPCGIDAMATRLLVPYDEPFDIATLRGLETVAVGAVPVDDVEGPNWIGSKLGGWMAPSAVLISLGADTGDANTEAAMVALGLAYAPIGAVGGLLHGSVTSARWRPCLNRLGDTLEELQPNVLLQARLRETLAGHVRTEVVDVNRWGTNRAVMSAGKARGLLLGEMTRVELRPEEKAGRFFVEVGFRLRLWEMAERRWLYDRAFVYTAGAPELLARQKGFPQTPLLQSSPSLRMKDYCGDDGCERFRRQIEFAIEALVDEIRVELESTRR